MTTPKAENRRRPRRASVARQALVIGGLALALTACKTLKLDRYEITGGIPDDYRVIHPIAIDDSVHALDIPVSMHAARLPDPVKSTIKGFARRFLDSGAAVIAIVTPSGSADETAAVWLGYQVKDVLVASGVEAKAIDFRVYRANGEGNAPVRLAYSTTTATTAGCGPWPDQVARSKENRHYYNYGCATQQNLAAIVANPLDLLYPRGMTPADATRRATVLEKYQKGDAYQTDYTRETGGKVAEGVGNQ